MQIIVTPSDLIQRCLWDKYDKFCLHTLTSDEVKKIIENNKPISLSENDAYVIGLLKVIETDNFVHRFNEEMLESLHIKSNTIDDKLYIKKSSVQKQVDNYLLKFPDAYVAPAIYKIPLEELKVYLIKIKKAITGLEIINVKKNDIVVSYYNSKEVKQCLDL